MRRNGFRASDPVRQTRAMLEDGTYDALVIDAETVEGEGSDGVVRLDLTIIAGPYKGEVVAIRGRFGASDPVDLLGLPATIVVTSGEPSVTLEP